MNNRFADILNPSKYGLIEFLFVSLPMLSAYNHIDYYIIVMLAMLSFIKIKGRLYKGPRALTIMIAYAIIHEILVCMFVTDVPTYHINNTLLRIVVLLSIFIITPALNFEKLFRCYILFTIIVVAGLLYHVILIRTGSSVTMIKIPFLPLDSNSSAMELSYRPLSFFLEPSNLNAFLIFPLFFSLYYKKYLLSVVITISVFISTSTNGIVTTGVMLLTYFFTQNMGLKRRLLLIALIVISGAFLVYSDFAQDSRTKVENTDVESTSRLINGPSLVSGMPVEHLIVGFPAVSVEQYKDKTNYIPTVQLLGKNDAYFVSAFWLILAKFGVVGLFLFFWAYYSIYKQNHHLIVIMLPLFVLKFSSGGAFDYGTFINTTLILAFVLYENKMQHYISGGKQLKIQKHENTSNLAVYDLQ